MARYKQFSFDIPVFKGYLLVHVGPGLEKAFNRYEKECHLKLDTEYIASLDFSKLSGCFVYPRDFSMGILWLRSWREDWLVHEAMHATAHYMRMEKAPLNETSEELYAKFISYIVAEIRSKFKKAKWRNYG